MSDRMSDRMSGSTSERMSNDFNAFDNDFRTHYQNTYANRGRDYSYYEPGYRYGYDLGEQHPDWRGRRWDEIERDAQRDWDSTHGPWDEFKDAVRNAWERLTN